MPQPRRRSARCGPIHGCPTRQQRHCQLECGPRGCTRARAPPEPQRRPRALSSSTSATKPS
eukprot:6859723-Alexandrium_andersonii.AAC.1